MRETQAPEGASMGDMSESSQDVGQFSKGVRG